MWNKKFNKAPLNLFLVIVISFLSISFGGLKTISAAATLSFSPSSVSVNTGDSFTVNVGLNTGNSNVVVVRAIIHYDTSLISVNSWSTASSSFVSGNSCQYNGKACEIIDNDTANGNLSITLAKPTTGINTASGLIASISFRALAPMSNSSSAISMQFVASGNYTDSDVIADDDNGTDLLTGVSSFVLTAATAALSGGGGGSAVTPNSPASTSTTTQANTASSTLVASTSTISTTTKANASSTETSTSVTPIVISDKDGDGLTDEFENAVGTDPNKKDSDADGYDDKTEIKGGFNPLGKNRLIFDSKLAKANLGKIFLQIENKGQAWYINPTDQRRYFLGRPADAFQIMRKLGLGAKHTVIVNTKIYPARLLGRILIDVEDKGKAYYINPKDKKAYYLGRANDAFNVMRQQGVGISNVNLNKIGIGF